MLWQGLPLTVEWYKANPTYWQNLSTALLPHPQLPADADAQTAENVATKSGASPHAPAEPEQPAIKKQRA